MLSVLIRDFNVLKVYKLCIGWNSRILIYRHAQCKSEKKKKMKIHTKFLTFAVRIVCTASLAALAFPSLINV